MISYDYPVLKDDYENAGMVSSQIKGTLKQIGISSEILRRIAVACYEGEINMIIHSDGGKIYLRIEPEQKKVELEFADVGPGIPDVKLAMTPGWSTASEKARELGFGAGMGLVNIKRVSDSFDLKTGKEGTTITVGFLLS